MKKYILLVVVALGLGMAASAQTKQRFDPALAIQDIRVEGGVYFNPNNGDGAGLLQLTRNRQIWGPFAARTGLALSGDGLGYSSYTGLPLGISYCPGTRSFMESLIMAGEASIIDIIVDGITGNTDQIGPDILANLALLIFRRTEYFVGVTPGWWGGRRDLGMIDDGRGRFSTTLDAGIVIAIPLRRLAINLTPVYHYSLTKNICWDGTPKRHFMSFTAGLSYLF